MTSVALMDDSDHDLFINTYSPGIRVGRRVRPSHVRDGLSIVLMTSLLQETKLRLKEFLFNLPNARAFIDLSTMKARAFGRLNRNSFNRSFVS